MSDAPVAAIPPVQADLTQGEGDATRINKQWYYYWRNLGQKIDTLGLAIQYGTHDTRPNPDEVPPGSLFSEGSVLYQNLADGWHYLAGTQWGTLSPDQRPIWLGPNDAGYDFRTTDASDVYAPREFIWSGSVWVEATFLFYGTHAARPAADSLTPPRTLYVETDRGNVLYQQQANAWHYVAGVMSGTMTPDQRPTGLGVNDTGFQYRATDVPRTFVWSGSAWVETSGYWVSGTAGAIYYTGGNVGIGTASPLAPLHAKGSGAVVEIESSGDLSTTGLAYLKFIDSTTNFRGYLGYGGGATGSLDISNFNNGPLIFVTNSAVRMFISGAGNVGIGTGTVSPTYRLQLDIDSAAKPGTNAWTIASDIRVKKNVRRFEGDMEVIRRLDPIVAEYNGAGGTPEGSRVLSFDAEKLREIVPHAVSSVRGKLHPEDEEETDLLGVNTHEIFYHMLRAIQQLDAEIQALKQKP